MSMRRPWAAVLAFALRLAQFSLFAAAVALPFFNELPGLPMAFPGSYMVSKLLAFPVLYLGVFCMDRADDLSLWATGQLRPWS